MRWRERERDEEKCPQTLGVKFLRKLGTSFTFEVDSVVQFMKYYYKFEKGNNWKGQAEKPRGKLFSREEEDITD